MENIGHSETPSLLRHRATLCVALLAAAVATLVLLARHFSAVYGGNVVDDALISLQYAKNLVAGNGLVFNPGERVEGYTNFLWTLALAGVHAVTPASWFLPAAVVTSVFAAVAALVLVFLLGRQLWGADPLPMAVALGLTALDNAYGVWAMQALEGHFLLVWILLALLLAERRGRGWPVGVGLCLAAVVMTRPDGALVGVAIALSELAGLRTHLREKTLVPSVKGWGMALGVFALVYGAYFAWRYSYYGWLLPNTFYLKVGGGTLDGWARGLAYVKSFSAERGWVPLLAIPAVVSLRRPLIRTLLIYALLHTAYVIQVGGDFYPGHRFLLVLIPILALLAAESVRRGAALLPGGIPQLAMALLAVGVVAHVARLGFLQGPYETEIRRWGPVIEKNRRYMEWVKTIAPPGASMVLGDIGAAGFFADLRVVDFLGVVDETVAHQVVPTLGKGKAGHEKQATREYVFGRAPTFIKLGYVHGDLYPMGYWLNGEMPMDLDVEGLWVRDDLPSRAEKISSLDLTAPGWSAEGNAFSTFPQRSRVRGQRPVIGTVGPHVNTFLAGVEDGATGTLRSPPFPIEGDRLTLRVGGGHDPEKLRVSLLIDGERVASATGRNSEMLARKEWDVSRWKGREAVLEVVDGATGSWGHLIVDEIEQWRSR